MKVFVCSATNGPISMLIWEGSMRDLNGNIIQALVFTMMTPKVNTSGVISNGSLVDISGKTSFGTTTFDKITTKVGDVFTLTSANLYTLQVTDITEVAKMPVVTSTPKQPAQYRQVPQTRPNANPAQGVIQGQNQQMIDYVNGMFDTDQ